MAAIHANAHMFFAHADGEIQIRFFAHADGESRICFFLLMQMVTAGSVFLLDGKGKTRSGRLDTAFRRLSWAPLDSFTKF